MTRLLLTGATGFIGQHLVTHLLTTTNIELVLLLRETYADVRRLPQRLAQQRAHYNTVYADLRNYNLTSRALQQAQPDVVIHLAAAGATTPFLPVNTAIRNNLTATLNLMRASFKPGYNTQNLILARTPGEKTLSNPYATSKAAAWQFAHMYANTEGWPITGAMIYQAYGPHQPSQNLIPAAITAAQANQDLPMTSGTQAKDWIYITDLVAGLAAIIPASLPPATSLDLGTGQATPVADVVAQIYALTASHGRPRPGLLPNRPAEAPTQLADLRHTQQHIAWTPTTPLTAGLQQTITAYNQTA